MNLFKYLLYSILENRVCWGIYDVLGLRKKKRLGDFKGIYVCIFSII